MGIAEKLKATSLLTLTDKAANIRPSPRQTSARRGNPNELEVMLTEYIAKVYRELTARRSSAATQLPQRTSMLSGCGPTDGTIDEYQSRRLTFRRGNNVISWAINKIAIIAIAAVVVLGVTGCSGKSGSSQATPQQSSTAGPSGTIALPKKTVGILNIAQADPSAAAFQAAAVDAIQALGWDYVAVDTAGDASKMASGMMSLVNQKVDAILDLSCDTPQITQGLDAAKSANIPVVSFGSWLHSSPNLLAEVAPSELTLESLLDYYIISAMGGFNSSGKIFLLTRTTGLTMPIRQGQLETTLKALMPDVEIVGEHSVNEASFASDVMSATRAALAADPDINVIWAGKANYANPASQAVDQAGLHGKVTIVTYYSTDQNLDLLRKGEISAIADFSIPQNAWTAVDVLAQYFGKQQMPTWLSQFSALPLQYSLITQGNVPPEGQPYTYPVDAKQYFLEKWRQEFSNVQ